MVDYFRFETIYSDWGTRDGGSDCHSYQLHFGMPIETLESQANESEQRVRERSRREQTRGERPTPNTAEHVEQVLPKT